MLSFGLSRTFLALVVRYFLDLSEANVLLTSSPQPVFNWTFERKYWYAKHLCSFDLYILIQNAGVMKSVMGELTDPTNRAEGFALLPITWGFGATMGCVIWNNHRSI